MTAASKRIAISRPRNGQVGQKMTRLASGPAATEGIIIELGHVMLGTAFAGRKRHDALGRSAMTRTHRNLEPVLWLLIGIFLSGFGGTARAQSTSSQPDPIFSGIGEHSL